MFTNDWQQAADEKETMKKVTKLGSKWNNGLKSGTFYWNLNNATSNRNRNISRQSVNARYSRGKSKKRPGCFYIISVFLNTLPHGKTVSPQGKLKITFSCIGRL